MAWPFYFFGLSKYKSTFDNAVHNVYGFFTRAHLFLWVSWASFAMSIFLFFFFVPPPSSRSDDDARYSHSIFLSWRLPFRVHLAKFASIARLVLLTIKLDAASIAVEVDGVAGSGERKAFFMMFFILWVKRSVDCSRYICTTWPGKPASSTLYFANVKTSFHSLPWQINTRYRKTGWRSTAKSRESSKLVTGTKKIPIICCFFMLSLIAIVLNVNRV